MEKKVGVDNEGFEADIELRENNKTEKDENPNQNQIDDCGFCVNLPALNKLRGPKWFLFFLSLGALCQGFCVNGLINTAITSIERRFGLKSAHSGIIASSYDIGSMIAMIPVSYFGGRRGASKPRWIGLGLLCLGLGSLVYTVPHFATPVYTLNSEGGGADNSSLCGDLSQISGSRGRDNCQEEGEEVESSLASYRYVFILGQLLHGAGAAPLITLGITFLEESVSQTTAPLYISVFQASFIVGPALGYMLGGQLLTLHTDFLQEGGPSHSLWVGAWWPGFLITCAGAITVGCLILCYPASINRRRNTADRSDQADSSPDILTNLVDILKILKSLLTNPVYMFVTLAIAVDGFILGGLTAFLPKFLSEQFQQTAAFSAQIIGLLAVTGGASGALVGGAIMKRLKLSVERTILLIVAIQLTNVFCLFIFLLHCPTLPYVGLTLPPAACSSSCSCPATSLDPVCGSDGLMYLSPCQAGCRTALSPTNFTDCSCVQDSQASAVGSLCENDCNYFLPMIIVCFVSMILSFLVTLPEIVTTLKSVKVEEKSMAVGVQTIVARLVGGIPGPILYGYFIDNTCILWQQNNCDDSSAGSCLVYDNYQFSLVMCVCCVTVKTISALFFLLSYLATRCKS